VEGEAFEKAVERVSAAGCEVRAESVAADIFEFVLVWKRGYGALGIVF